MRSSLHADSMQYNLVLKLIQKDTLDYVYTELQMISGSRSDYDSYLWGKLPEFLRVSSATLQLNPQHHVRDRVPQCPGSHISADFELKSVALRSSRARVIASLGGRRLLGGNSRDVVRVYRL